MTHLRKAMLEELQRRNLSQITTRIYLHAVEEFSQYFNQRYAMNFSLGVRNSPTWISNDEAVEQYRALSDAARTPRQRSTASISYQSETAATANF